MEFKPHPRLHVNIVILSAGGPSTCINSAAIWDHAAGATKWPTDHRRIRTPDLYNSSSEDHGRIKSKPLEGGFKATLPNPIHSRFHHVPSSTAPRRSQQLLPLLSTTERTLTFRAAHSPAELIYAFACHLISTGDVSMDSWTSSVVWVFWPVMNKI